MIPQGYVGDSPLAPPRPSFPPPNESAVNLITDGAKVDDVEGDVIS